MRLATLSTKAAFLSSPPALHRTFCAISRSDFLTHPRPPALYPTPLSSRRASTRTTRASSTSPKTPIKLAPSDFAFIYEDCKRCFYLKAHKILFRPRAPFPKVFNTIDLAMKRHFRGLRTTDVIPSMKPGVFLCEDEDAWVETAPMTPPGASRPLFIRGMLDCVVRFDDGTYGVIDFKTSSVEGKASMYARQLHAYAAALETPGKGSELVQGKVSDLGLIIYQPCDFTSLSPTGAALTGKLEYVNVPRNDADFNQFLGEVMQLLEKDEAPSPPPKGKKAWAKTVTSCPYCQFLHETNQKCLVPS